MPSQPINRVTGCDAANSDTAAAAPNVKRNSERVVNLFAEYRESSNALGKQLANRLLAKVNDWERATGRTG